MPKLKRWEDVTGYFNIENYEMFKSFDLPENPVIVECGTCWGRSCNAFYELWPKSEIHTCDPKDYHPQIPPNCTFHNIKAKDLPWDKPIDLLFIDDSHMEPDVEENFNRFYPFVKRGGYIVFHDYYENATQDVIAVEKLVKKIKDTLATENNPVQVVSGGIDCQCAVWRK